MDTLRQPKFSQASAWFPSWFYSVFPDTNGASTQWCVDKENGDMVVASSRSGHRGVVLTLEESSCFDCNEVKGQTVLNYGYLTHAKKGLNCEISGVIRTRSERCHCIDLFESVHTMGITVDKLNEPDALLTGSVKALSTFNNGCSQKCLMMDHVHFSVEPKQAGVLSSDDTTSKQTSSTEFYEPPVVSVRNDLVPVLPCLNECSSKPVALLLKRFSLSLNISPCCKFVDKETGNSILHKKSAGDTEDKSRVRVEKRRISETTMNMSRKKKRYESVFTDLESTVALTVAAAEAMVIASCLISCDAPNEFGPSVVLEAAMQVRKARQSIGLDDFSMEMQSPVDVVDFTESECLADSQKVLADGGSFKLLEDKCMASHVLGNIEGKCDVSQHKEKESTLHPRRHLCKFKQNDGPYVHTADEDHGEFSALDCKNLGSALLLGSYDKNSEAASPHSIVEERPCNGATCLSSSKPPEQIFLSRKEEKPSSSWSKNAFSGGPDDNDSKRPFKPFSSRWFGGWEVIGDYADEKTGDSINSQSSQAFSGCQDTAYLEEPKILQKIVNLKSKRHYGSRKYNPLTVRKANSGSESLPTRKEPIVVSVPEKQPQNLSQASVAGSITSPGDPLCSFVPCSLLSPPLPSAALSEVNGSFKERPYTLKFANRENVNESTQMMNISMANIFGKVCLHNSPVRLMSRNPENDPFFDKDDGPCLNSTEDDKGLKIKGVKCSRAVSLRRYSTNSNCLGELLAAVNCICDQNKEKAPGVSSIRVEDDPKYRSSGATFSDQCYNASEPAVLLKKNMAILDSILSPKNITGGNSGKVVSIEVPVTAVASRHETKRKVKFSDVSRPDYFVKWHHSPPLLFPRGRRKRLKAEIIVDTGSSDEIFNENLQGHSRRASEDMGNIPAIGRKTNLGFIDRDETCPNKSRSGNSDQHNDSIKPTLLNATTMTKHQKLKDRCRDKVKSFSDRKMAAIKVSSEESQKRHLFRGLKFLLTGFTEKKKKTVMKLIKVHGGEIALHVPQSCSSQVIKAQRLVCREKQYIVIAANKVRTPKFLYGCAVGSPPLETSWIMDSISAGKLLSQSQYKLAYDQELKETLSKAGNRCGNNQRKGKIFGGMLFLIYGRATFRSKVTPILQHGGGQILQGSRSMQCDSSKAKLSQVIIVEDMDKIPRGVRHSATNLNVPIVSEKWVVESLVHGSLLELPATSGQGRLKETTMKNSVLPFSSVDCIRKCQTLGPTTNDPSNESTKIFEQSALWKAQHNTSIYPKSYVKDSFRMDHKGSDFTLVGRGFSNPPKISTFSYAKSKQLQDDKRINHCPKNKLYYKKVLYADVEYSVGDCVEICEYMRGKILSSIVRIECFWLEKASFKTTASKLTSSKNPKQACHMMCRRFYRPQETNFAGCGSEKEIFVSNDFVESVSICKLQSKVKISIKVGEIISILKNRGNNQGNLNLKRNLRSLDLINFDYACNFFYDHEHESLHLLT